MRTSTYKILETPGFTKELFMVVMEKENNSESLLRVIREMSLESHRTSYPGGCLYLNSKNMWVKARDYQFDAMKDFIKNHIGFNNIVNNIKVENEYYYNISNNNIRFKLKFIPHQDAI